MKSPKEIIQLSRNQTLKNSHHHTVLQKENKPNLTFNIKSFQSKECTYLLLGDLELTQPAYNCSTCDPNRMDMVCYLCYENCHSKCKKDSRYPALLGIESFVCICGKANKHYITPPKKNMKFTACKFRQLDKKINNTCIYRCETEEVNLCSICFHECHSYCEEAKKKKIVLNPLIHNVEAADKANFQEDLNTCECNHENHAAMNEFTFNINPESYVNDCELPYIWPVQMLNVLFNSENIYDELTDFIHRNLIGLKYDVKFANVVSQISEIFNSQFKTYYYHPKIMNIFPYDIFTNFLCKFEATNKDETLLKMKLVYIFLFVHVKKDFNMIKSLTISDFMTNTILERLLYREFIQGKNIYTKEIHEKYFLSTHDETISNFKRQHKLEDSHGVSLTTISTMIGSILAKSIKTINVNFYKKEFSVCLKFITFMLKKMIFSVDELKNLIDSLADFNNEFLNILKDEETGELNDKVNDLIEIYSYLIKIFYLISVNYSDLRLNELLIKDTEEVEKSECKFMQTFDNYNGKLFNMIVKNCNVITNYYKKVDLNDNQNTLSKKIIKIYNESLKFFCLADNIYYIQLEKITPIEMKKFYVRKRFLSGEGKSQNNNINEERRILKEFKEKIENTLDEFFTYTNITDTNERLIAYLKEYSNKALVYDSYSNYDSVASPKKVIDLEALDEEEKLNRNRIEAYVVRLINTIKDSFPFVTHEHFRRNIDFFIDELIYCAIDETISKFLFFFCQDATGADNILPGFEIEIILSFLSLFCLNKAGLKYFCSGKNLTRIVKIFYQYPKRILQFFYMVFKGLLLFKVELTDNKIVHTIREVLTKYMKSYKINTRNELLFRGQVVLIFKIFHIASDSFEYDDYESLKKEMMEFMKEHKYLSRDVVIRLYEFDYENEKKIIHDLEKNRQDSKRLLDQENKENFFTFEHTQIPKLNLTSINKQSNDDSYYDKDSRINLLEKSKLNSKNDFQDVNYLIKKQNQENFKESNISNTIDLKSPNDQSSDEENEDDIDSSNNSSENSISRSKDTSTITDNTRIKDTSGLDENLVRNSVNGQAIMEKLFFSYLNLINKNTYFLYNTADDFSKFYDILDMNDLLYYKIILRKKDILTIQNRKILLQFLRTFYFIDIIDPFDINKKYKFLSSTDYKKYYINTLNSSQKIKIDNIYTRMFPNDMDYTLEQEEDLKRKYELVLNIQSVMEIFIQEIEQFDLVTQDEKDHEFVELYLKELVYSVKFISDFIYYNELWNNVIVTFFNLVKVFIYKSWKIKEMLIKLGNKSNQESDPEDLHNNIDDFKLSVIHEVKDEGDKNKTVEISPPVNEKKFAYTMKPKKENLKNMQVISLMENSDFDIFDKNKIYDLLIGTLTDIFHETNIDKAFNLKKFLQIYDSTQELNFTPFELIENKDYEYFYESDEPEEATDPYEIKLNAIKELFNNQFIDISKTTFMHVLHSISSETETIDCRGIIVNYFVGYISSDIKHHNFTNTNTLLAIIAKMMFFDTENTQNKLTFMADKEYDSFFEKFNYKLKNIFVLNFVSAKNFFNLNRSLTITSVNKLIIQFLQLLAEGFNTTFHKRIFTSVGEDSSFTIFDTIVKNLIFAFKSMNINYFANGELCFDKMIVLITNLIDFMIEYTQQNIKMEEVNIVHKYIEMFFDDKIHTLLYLNLKPNGNFQFERRQKILIYLKIKFISLIISHLQNKQEEFKFITKELGPAKLFGEILINFVDIMKVLVQKKKVIGHIFTTTKDDFLKKITLTYIYEEEFRDSLQLNLCFKIYQLIKIFSDIYEIESIKKHFEDVVSNDLLEDNPADIDHITLKSRLAYYIYLFLEKVICKVEIRSFETGENCPTFFVRPSLTFLLTNQTMTSFVDKVNRDTTFSKLNSLIEMSDYFIFEMVCNSHHKRKDLINKLFQKLELDKVEVINYIIIIIHQFLIFSHFYHPVEMVGESYETLPHNSLTVVYNDNLILAIIQLILLTAILAMWFYYKFPLYFQQNIKITFRKNFIFQTDNNNAKNLETKTIVQKVFNDQEMTPMHIIDYINKDIPMWKRFKIGLIDSVAGNREINTLFFTFVLVFLYLIIGSPLILGIPTMLIANLSPILSDLLLAVYTRWKQLVMVLFFTYLSIYLFTWMGMMWLSQLFFFSGAVDGLGGEAVTESYCTSTIQCYFFLLDYGIRAGGGIGDIIPMVSYRANTPFFFTKFFYNSVFYIIIVLILQNVILGIIVDTFGELRDKNDQTEYDKKLKCYICQISKDDSLNKKIDFDQHCKVDHYIWNYVYFLTYLHITNPNDFNALQNQVWDCLSSKDISWVPIESGS